MASIGQLRELPAISGIPVTRELLARGLRADGPIVRDPRDLSHWRLGRREVFVIRHPDLVDHVLHDAVDRYHKSLEYELLRSVLGLNLFTDEDESWRRHRMLLNPVMAKRHVAGMCELMIDPIATFVDELDRRGDRAELEMGSEMTALTLDVVGAALFGHGFGQLAREMRRVVTSGLHAAERAERLVMVLGPPAWLIRACAGAVHHSPVVPPPLNRIQWVMRTVDRCVWELIDDRRAHPTDTGELLNLLLSAEDEHGRLPLRRVRDEVTTFMLAGHETTANAMAWMWYLLALHADHRERMLEEVNTVLGGRRPTVEDVPRLQWTTACFLEAMRFYCPVWAIPRVCVAEDRLAGKRVRKGATVVIPVHALHHDERFWPEPEVFDPARFLPENVKGRHRSAYLPFGGGRRICIGTSFALMEATLMTAMMSRDFVFDLVPGHPVTPEATLTLRPRYGIRMTARRRSVAAPDLAAAA